MYNWQQQQQQQPTTTTTNCALTLTNVVVGYLKFTCILLENLPTEFYPPKFYPPNLLPITKFGQLESDKQFGRLVGNCLFFCWRQITSCRRFLSVICVLTKFLRCRFFWTKCFFGSNCHQITFGLDNNFHALKNLVLQKKFNPKNFGGL